MNRTEAGRGSVRKEIADKLRRGCVIAAARKKCRVFDLSLHIHSGERMVAAEILRLDADEQRAVRVFRPLRSPR